MSLQLQRFTVDFSHYLWVFSFIFEFFIIFLSSPKRHRLQNAIYRIQYAVAEGVIIRRVLLISEKNIVVG